MPHSQNTPFCCFSTFNFLSGNVRGVQSSNKNSEEGDGQSCLNLSYRVTVIKKNWTRCFQEQPFNIILLHLNLSPAVSKFPIKDAFQWGAKDVGRNSHSEINQLYYPLLFARRHWEVRSGSCHHYGLSRGKRDQEELPYPLLTPYY